MEQLRFDEKFRFQLEKALRKVHGCMFDSEHVNTVVNLETDQKMLAHAIEPEVLGDIGFGAQQVRLLSKPRQTRFNTAQIILGNPFTPTILGVTFDFLQVPDSAA